MFERVHGASAEDARLALPHPGGGCIKPLDDAVYVCVCQAVWGGSCLVMLGAPSTNT